MRATKCVSGLFYVDSFIIIYKLNILTQISKPYSKAIQGFIQ